MVSFFRKTKTRPAPGADSKVLLDLAEMIIEALQRNGALLKSIGEQLSSTSDDLSHEQIEDTLRVIRGTGASLARDGEQMLLNAAIFESALRKVTK